MKTTDKKIKIGIEMANGDSFQKRVGEILKYHSRLCESAYKPEEISGILRDSIKRALDNAEVYARQDGKLICL